MKIDKLTSISAKCNLLGMCTAELSRPMYIGVYTRRVLYRIAAGYFPGSA